MAGRKITSAGNHAGELAKINSYDLFTISFSIKIENLFLYFIDTCLHHEFLFAVKARMGRSSVNRHT